MKNQVKQNSGKLLSSVLDTIVKESLKSALQRNAYEEQEKQAAMTGMVREEDPADDSEDSAPPAESKTQEDEKDKLKKGEIKTKDIVDKLNTIRAGKSFKDSAIASKMDEYIESLSKPEKVALLAFLKGLSQIVTGEVEPETALEPSDNPASVEMKKSNEKQTKTIKPIVIKAPEKEKSEKKPSSEDTSGPVPIKPTKK